MIQYQKSKPFWFYNRKESFRVLHKPILIALALWLGFFGVLIWVKDLWQ